MLKRNITYENLDEQSVTETFYFNLTRTEVVKMELDHVGGLEVALQRMIKAKDLRSIMAEIEKIILMSYGVKSDDGRRFMKSDDIRQEFIETGAFDALFMELATDDKAAASFVTSIIPKGFAEALAKGPDINLPTVMPSIPNKE